MCRIRGAEPEAWMNLHVGTMPSGATLGAADVVVPLPIDKHAMA
jgi:hypothetical protein